MILSYKNIDLSYNEWNVPPTTILNYDAWYNMIQLNTSKRWIWTDFNQ